MYKNKRILALIPARGGSKRLSKKNIRPLSGEPLIARTIEQAKNSKYIDRIIVSTDDEEIAGISKKYGAEVPFLRPRELAADNSKSVDVILHAVERLKNNDSCIYDLIILLQPTSPLRASEDIDKALELLFTKEAEAVVSVCKDGHEGSYKPNGAIYSASYNYIKKYGGFFGGKTLDYVMPEDRSVDIDDETDFRLAEFLIKKTSGSKIGRYAKIK